jgi:transcriptional regulator with XRE-family HTH domain
MEEFISDRIRKLMELEGLSASAFADQIQVQRSSISHIMAGRNKPSLDFIEKILSAFPEVQAQWLITGTGPMKQLHLFDDKAYQPRTEYSDPIPQIKPEPKKESNPESALTYEPHFEPKTEVKRQPIEEKVLAKEEDPIPYQKIHSENLYEKRQEEREKSKNAENQKEGFVSKLPSSKKIVQIVLVYDDHTFTVLNPDQPIWEK